MTLEIDTVSCHLDGRRMGVLGAESPEQEGLQRNGPHAFIQFLLLPSLCLAH